MLKGLKKIDTSKESMIVYDIIKKGGLTIVPNSVGYGFNCHSGESVKRKYNLKGRQLDNKCVCIADLEIFNEIVDCSDEEKIIAEEVSKRYPVSFVVPYHKESEFLKNLDKFALTQVTKDGTIAIYLNLGELEEKIVSLGKKDNVLIIGSSANLSHTGNKFTLEDIEENLRKGVDYFVDGGICPFHSMSKMAGTIIDLKTLNPIRKGVLYLEIIGAINYLKNGKIVYPD